MRALRLPLALLVMLAFTGCGRNTSGHLLVPTGIRPAPAVPTRGEVMRAVLSRMVIGGRVALCGVISNYNSGRAADDVGVVEGETLVVGFTSDWLFPPEQNRVLTLALLRAGRRASYAELATDLGHDSFLLESEDLYALVRSFLEREEPYTFDYSI